MSKDTIFEIADDQPRTKFFEFSLSWKLVCHFFPQEFCLLFLSKFLIFDKTFDCQLEQKSNQITIE